MANAGELLRQKVAEQGTVAGFARKCGVPRSSIYNWFKNFDTMPAGTLRVVSEILSISPNEFLGANWESGAHIEVCTDREAELLYKYRNDTVIREFVDKITK